MGARIAVVAVMVAIVAALGYFFVRPYFEPRELPPPPALKAPPETKKEPAFPIGAETKPLPNLGESDPTLRESIAGLIDPVALAKFFNLEGGIRRIVATVDNLPRELVADTVNVMRPMGGTFLVTGKDDSLAIGPKNFARYTPFVR